MAASKKMYEDMQEGQKALEAKAAMVQSELNKETDGDNVHTALLTIQLGLKAPKTEFNSFAKFNYRTAGAILEAVKPFLDATGCTLLVDDNLELIGSRYYVHSCVTLYHIKTGEAISSNGYAREAENEKGKMDAQMTGGASTFAKKYALANLFALDDSQEDPDHTSGQQPVKKNQLSVTPAVLFEAFDQNRVTDCVIALQAARDTAELNYIRNEYGDVRLAPAVQQAGKEAMKRINNK